MNSNYITINFDVKSISNRSPWKLPVQEGGALNANYTQSEALAIVCNKLGQHGLEYGKDFEWVDTFLDEVQLKILDKHEAVMLKLSI